MLDLKDDIQLEYRESDRMKFLPLFLAVFFALLSFFIMMNVISAANSTKSENLKKALKNEFLNKKLSEELVLKIKTASDTDQNNFRDLITKFLDIQKNINAEIVESPDNYILKLKLLNFFSPDSTVLRVNGAEFVNSLNKYLEIIKKQPDSKAKLLVLYNPAKSIDAAIERIGNLQKAAAKSNFQNISFSLKATETDDEKDKINNVYILFDKNGF